MNPNEPSMRSRPRPGPPKSPIQLDVCSFSSLKIKMGFQGYFYVQVIVSPIWDNITCSAAQATGENRI